MSDCRVCGAKCPGWFMCGQCAGEVEHCIAEMPSLMHELSNVATGQTNVYRASGKPQSDLERFYDPEASITPWLRSRDGRVALRPTRLMVRLDVQELAWVAGNTLTSWARHLAESRGAELPSLRGGVRRRLYIDKNRMHVWTRQFPDMHIDPLIGWLLGHVNSMRLDETAAEIHDEITTLHAQMERSVDRSPSRLFAGPCHAPGMLGKCERDLYRRPGAHEISCDGWRDDGVGCGAKHAVEDRREWLSAEVESALVTLDEMLSALSWLYPDLQRPPRAVVMSWVRNGKIVAHGLSHVGEPTYVGGEIMELVRTYKPHQFAPRRKRQAA